MFKTIQSASISGSTSVPVSVEISATKGLPQETIIGLPDTVIKESRTRVKSAILLSQYDFPAMSYVINLAPTDVLKRNISLELAISVGILNATGQITVPNQYCFIGGLSLDGQVIPIRHILPMIYYYPNHSTLTFVISSKNIDDISPLDGIRYIPIDHLHDLRTIHQTSHHVAQFKAPSHTPSTVTFDDVKGQQLAKYACVFSIIGRHPLLFIGSPGIGKTMLIDRMPSLCPPLTNQQSLENCCIELLLCNDMNYHSTPPYRTPHHSISYAGMIGGKNPPQPGEITRANHGLLFLDEIGEYQRAILDTLREPLETQQIKLSRAGNSVTFPADFLLVSAMNPCYCGHYFDLIHACQCIPSQLQRYWQKISQPFLDRISICCILTKPTVDAPTISHHDMQQMVQSGISMTKKRNPHGVPNHRLPLNMVLDTLSSDRTTQDLLHQFFDQHTVSMRAQQRLLQLCRTIADAFNEVTIQSMHISLAIQLTQHHQLPGHASSPYASGPPSPSQ